MRIDVSELLRTSRGTLSFSFSELLTGCGNEIDGYIFDTPVEFIGNLENINGVLRVVGSLKAEYKNTCSRCLENLKGGLSLDIHESIVEDGSDDDPDVYTYKDGIADIGRIAQDNIILNMPMRLICSEDCKGLCPLCGVNLNVSQCDCGKDHFDSRFSKLEGYFKDKKPND